MQQASERARPPKRDAQRLLALLALAVLRVGTVLPVSAATGSDGGNASYSSVIAGSAWILDHQRPYDFKVANLSR